MSDTIDLSNANSYVPGQTEQDLLLKKLYPYSKTPNKYLFFVTDFAKYQEYLAGRDSMFFAYTFEEVVKTFNSHTSIMDYAKGLHNPILLVLTADSSTANYDANFSYTLKPGKYFKDTLKKAFVLTWNNTTTKGKKAA